MRGEKKFSRIEIRPISGSSPHARGKEIFLIYIDSSNRIIPACAGKSLMLVFLKAGSQDHPRMRGEK